MSAAAAEPSLSPIARWLEQPASPYPLALLRIVVFGLLSLGTLGILPGSLALFDILRYANLPQELIVPPTGLTWVPGTALQPWPVAISGMVLIVAAGAAALGWRVRWTGTIAVLMGVWVLAVPQFFGKVDHYHHLLWFAALLAASPSADALTPGSRKHGRLSPSIRYGFALRVTWIVLGLLYLGAGLAKARTGLHWAFSDTLRNYVWSFSFERGIPLLELPDVVWQLMAFGGLVFELGFLLAILHPRTRRWAAAAGIAFHLATYVTMGILFLSLMACYVVFLDEFRSLQPVDRQGGPRFPSLVVGFSLMTLVAGTGIAGAVDAWPVASYPSFAGIRGTTSDRLAVTVDGTEPMIPLATTIDWMSPSRVDGVTGAVLRDPTPERLAALGGVVQRASPWLASASFLELWHVRYSIAPDSRGDLVQDPERLARIPLGGEPRP